MKLYIRRIAMGLVVALLLGTLSACGERGAENMESPEVTPSESVGTSEPPVSVESLEPTESSYDPFDDPNVLWGDDSMVYDMEDMPPRYGDVHIHCIESLLDQAGEDNLIAFHIAAFSYGKPYQVDYSRVPLPEDVEENRELRTRLEACYSAGDDESRDDAWRSVINYKNTIENEAQQIDEKMKEIKETVWEKQFAYYNDPSNFENGRVADPSAAADKATERILGENEEYQALAAQYEKDSALLDWWETEILPALSLQYVEAIRANFVEKGFIPLYDLEDLYAAGEISFNHGFLRETTLEGSDIFFVLAFVGSKEQLESLKDRIDPECEGYFIYSSAKHDIFGVG